jgi:hypothetical protein
MKAYRVYEDCVNCKGHGEIDIALKQTCIACTERYIVELRTVLHDLLHHYDKFSDAIPDIEAVLKVDRDEL